VRQKQTIEFKRDLRAAQADRESLAAKKAALQMRARMLASIRAWFAAQGFLAVETPVRLPAPALEDYIEATAAEGQYLRTSPELHMKRLLAAGYERIYQIGPCFRKDEKGARHLPEFSMLEWYRAKSDWRQIQRDTVSLLRTVLQDCRQELCCRFKGQTLDFAADWDEISVSQAFRKYAARELQQCLQEGCFEEVLVSKVEPNLGLERPCFLSEYPLECSGLSAPVAGKPGFVERWELYVCGLELGNACSELLDPAEQERRFQACARLRQSQGRPVYDMDQDFMNALWLGMPKCAGIAIGLDRLAMLLCDAQNIDQVVAFPS
jgi:lysyl-tRNA synthetase class 2